MKVTELVRTNFALILGLGALALIRPLMKITGIMELIGQQFGSILMTLLISLAWLIIVRTKKVSQPVAILVAAGICYGVFAILISGILSPLLDGELRGPLTNPLAIVSMLAINALWGFMIGVIAKLWSRKS